MDYKDFVNQSFKNRKLLDARNGICGCYYCCKTFQFCNITQWVDNGETALCPKCRIDSVVSAEIEDHESFIIALRKASVEFF